MRRGFLSLLGCLLFALCMLSSASSAHVPAATLPVATAPKVTKVLVIPVKDEIDEPVLYVVRRGLKNAALGKYDAVLLDMDTPGGNLGVTLKILEALENFPGSTATYVNKDALSAGSFIAAMTQDIYFAPNGVIGAAAPVDSSGKDIEKTMKEKVVSYMKARVRALSEGKGPYRAQVISAMMDEDGELKIGDKVLKKDGKLLSLTALEANESYGDPARPLLGAGIRKDVTDLLEQKYGKNGYEFSRLEITWSERLASFLSSLKPLLMGLGLLAIFVEFKAGGSGVFAAIGLVLLAVVFASGYVSGLSGYEPAILFVIGLALLLVEVFVLPGVIVMAVAGLVLMCAGLLWSMADLWPSQPVSVAWSGDVFVKPLIDLGLGLVVAFGGGAALIGFLPKKWLWHRMVLEASVEGSSGSLSGPVVTDAPATGSLVVAATPLMPTGQIDFNGRRFQARIDVGNANTGDRLVVRGRSGFDYIVERV